MLGLRSRDKVISDLSVSLKCCPFQTINISPSVSVNNSQAEIPGVPVFQILEGVGGNEDPESKIFLILLNLFHQKESLSSLIKGRTLMTKYRE